MVEGDDISWEYKIGKIAISGYPNVEIKNLIPICNKDKRALNPTTDGNLFTCRHCGRQVPLSNINEQKKRIIDGLNRRIKTLNEPINKAEDKPIWRKFEGYIKD